jgi:hypothetical protein
MEDNNIEQVIEPGLLQTIKRFSLMTGLIHDTAHMRYYQKSFFRERDNARLKQEYLVKSKEYEAKVDATLKLLWPNAGETIKQTKLF